MEHIEQIAKIGPKNISFVDLVRGEIPRKNGQSIVIDKKILKSLKFIKEYESV
ncbi:MAG TPA: ATP-binding protein, partial [Spirochaetaceae bacterium]|nr:ATP-binding protein [Spirochaetaceae bacterium]